MRHFKLILLLLLTPIAMAGQSLTQDQAENYLQVESSDTVISFGGPRPADASAMEITIVTPDGNRITRLSDQSWMDIDLGKNVREGIYHYEVIYSIPTDTVVITPRGELEIPQETVRSSGFFRIHNGVIVENENQLEIQRPMTTQPEASHVESNPLIRSLAKVLHWLVPSASAQVNNSLLLGGNAPLIYFDDTQDEDCSPIYDWAILTNGGTSDGDTTNRFFINAGLDQAGCTGQFSTEIIAIRTDGDSDTIHSIEINADGSIGLAEDSVFINDASNRVGIGTTTPGENLEIQSGDPRILFDDNHVGTADFSLGEAFTDFTISIPNNGIGGPTGEVFTLDSGTGHFGLHIFAPEAPLTVQSPDNESAKILVENPVGVTAAPRTLLELRNPGNTKFSLNNTDKLVEWSFANPGSGFRVSRQGSGVVEFDLLNNGDLTIEGVLTENSDINDKQDIVAVDPNTILNKLSQIPISEWSYKDAPTQRHIGPMAQDFYAAFGLGKDETGIATLDSSGVALASIQALAKQYQALLQRSERTDRETANLKAENLRLKAENRLFETELAELKQQQQRLLELEAAVELLKQNSAPLYSSFNSQPATEGKL